MFFFIYDTCFEQSMSVPLRISPVSCLSTDSLVSPPHPLALGGRSHLLKHPPLPTVLLPRNLLHSSPPLPMETHGFGQLDSSEMRVVSLDVPLRKSFGAAGYDLYAVVGDTVPANGSILVDVGLRVQLPTQHYGKIEGITRLGLIHSIVVFGGVIDEDYNGSIFVKLFNFGSIDYTMKTGECIAQLIVQPYSIPKIAMVPTLESTERTFGGFSSVSH